MISSGIWVIWNCMYQKSLNGVSKNMVPISIAMNVAFRVLNMLPNRNLVVSSDTVSVAVSLS